MPPQAAAVLDDLRDRGMLEVEKSRPRPSGPNGRFAITSSSEGTAKHVTADVSLNCIGSECTLPRLRSPLVDNLIERGYIKGDPLNFGIDALPNGSVVGQNGQVNDVIYTLGTALKGTLWETTAIPEIRTQAAR